MSAVNPQDRKKGDRERQGVLRIELELEMEGEPVRGRLRSGGRSEAFVGWLALADALGRLHERSRTHGGGAEDAG
ncbi:MAG TPA: hypothetical protein VE127_14265 [Solirubrobacteraceae bacterium]|nr:hypothetical protein [Solirubrobacteraceae bacterium]